MNRGHHLYSAGRPSRWALAHILVILDSVVLGFFSVYSKLAANIESVDYVRQLVECLLVCSLPGKTNIIVDDINCGDNDWVNLRAPTHSVIYS